MLLLQSSFNTTHNHTRLKAREANTALGWTVFPHTLYSPDLAPSVFHLFEVLNDAILGERFGIDDELNEKVKKWLRMQKSNWLRNGLLARWSIAVEVDRDCVEK